MSIDPDRTIIAVFGSSAATKKRHPAPGWVGAAINRAGAVLLTGGLGPDDRGVKGAAIAGAEEGESPAWIGVAPAGAPADPTLKGDRAVVLTPGHGTRRNFVEACLCDAAIAVGGTTGGTASEVLFALYLARPVVVLGDPTEGPLDLRRLRAAAVQSVGKPTSDRTAVDRGVSAALLWAAEADFPVEITPMPGDAEGASVVVSDLLRETVQHDPRPHVGRLATAAAWEAYVEACLPLG